MKFDKNEYIITHTNELESEKEGTGLNYLEDVLMNNPLFEKYVQQRKRIPLFLWRKR